TRLLDFGTGVEGESSDLIVTFTNGAHPVSIGQAGASNPLLAPFGIVADACSNSTLAAGATCTITVRFSPGMGADFSDSFGLPVASTVIVNETIAVTGSAVGLIDVSA